MPGEMVVKSLDCFTARPADKNIIAIVICALELDARVLDEFANVVLTYEHRLEIAPVRQIGIVSVAIMNLFPERGTWRKDFA